tara:strand:+ start:316 stop:573 length:258 start_codon:yes stop_codon:yes gene_type:complete
MEKKVKEIIDRARLESTTKSDVFVKELLDLFSVSHSTTPSYLNDKYKVVQHVLDTYQVERNGEPVFRGEKEECYQYVKDELGYCG